MCPENSCQIIHRADNEPRQTLDLRNLVRKVLEETLREQVMSSIEFEAFMDGFNVETDMILGDPIAICEALRNLLDNAIKHGPEYNKINVRVQSDNYRISLIVEDAGPGISPNRYDSALKRFQSYAEDGRGSGLGLAIVNSVALSHAALLNLANSSNSPCELYSR